jgi:outer membrane protein OmpA-like peptidoglycan-associated protein
MARKLPKMYTIIAASAIQYALQLAPAASQTVPQKGDSFTTDELVCAFDPGCRSESGRSLTLRDPETPGRTAFFNNITFEFGSAELTSSAHDMLDRIGDALNNPKIGNYTYRIEGHTDAKGGVALNQTLSEQRAQAARDYLIKKHGISEKRLVAIGFGKTHPLPNPPASSPYAAINRRVQFTLLGLTE